MEYEKFEYRDGGETFVRCIEGIEKMHENCSNNSKKSTAKLDLMSYGESSKERHRLLRDYLKFVHILYETKYAQLTGALINSVNNDQFLVFAFCGRALIETAAIQRYYLLKALPIIDEAATTGFITVEQINKQIGLLDKHVHGGRFNWAEWFYGDRPEMFKRAAEKRRLEKSGSKRRMKGSEPAKITPDQVNVQTAIDHWAKETPEVVATYDYFCELVHPNVGNNFLVMGSNKKELTVGGSIRSAFARPLVDEGLKLLAAVVLRTALKFLALWVLYSDVGDPKPYDPKTH